MCSSDLSLVDSGSSDSFIDSTFVNLHHLPTRGIPPIKLRLMDGTSNSVITQGCMIVLGYRWLTHFNPTIDWVLGRIFFHQPSQPETKMSPPAKTLPSLAPLSSPGITNLETSEPSPLVKNRKPPRVTLINASAYICACKLEGTQRFQLRISLPEVTGRSECTPGSIPRLCRRIQ